MAGISKEIFKAPKEPFKVHSLNSILQDSRNSSWCVNFVARIVILCGVAITDLVTTCSLFKNNNQYSNNSKSQGQISAMYASPELAYDSSWYVDSGASSHITPEPQNLMTKNEYNGQEMVHVGNGAGLEINSIGHSFVKTSHSKPLILHDLLHVPKITKNLVIVSKFC